MDVRGGQLTAGYLPQISAHPVRAARILPLLALSVSDLGGFRVFGSRSMPEKETRTEINTKPTRNQGIIRETTVKRDGGQIGGQLVSSYLVPMG